MLSENILKAFYHLGERSRDFKSGRLLSEIEEARYISAVRLQKGLERLRKDNLVRKKDERWLLTKSGLKEARRIIRLHRLWEMYLNQRLKLQPDHVHNDAEAIEHIITPEIERQLEKELDFPEKDPHESVIPYPDR